MFFSLLPTLFYALASTAGAMLYPSFMSFKAIKTGKDTRVWLEYWIVFAIWRVFEWSVIDNLDLGSWPIVAIKLVFLGWLVFYHGASLIYKVWRSFISTVQLAIRQSERTFRAVRCREPDLQVGA